ncbi:MAG TPA: sensor histidine kinase [Kofleriaceae bacterium]|jgi:signal transduction histidine kinase
MRDAVLTREIRERVRRGVDLTVMIGGSLGTLVTLVGHWRGTGKEPLVATAVMLALAVCGFLGLIGRARWSPIAYVALVMVANVVYLVSFGPWLGLGAVYVLAVALALLFKSETWSWIVGVGLVATVVVVGILHHVGVLHRPSLLDLAVPNNWRRAGTATLTSLVGVAIIVNYTVRQLIKERGDIEKALGTQREQRLERERLDAEIGRVRRADSIAQLAAEVGADIGAALAIIQTRAAALRAELDTPDASQCLADIIDVTSVAGGTMRSLTVFGPDAKRTAYGNAEEAVRMLPRLVRRIIPARIALEVSADDNLCVGIDTSDLSRVVANLALNARDAIADRGTITIRATRDTTHVRIDVCDDGAGMSAEILGQLFQPFFTTKPIGRGTGLGLATTKILVERANGTIDVTSELGRGTTFTMRLPLLAQ